ncbi:MAG: protein kinase [Planctomycetaceae bacterium]|jgi:eukaryotic-like serine/threonine-protein kinase|nr:protein kinase [Planctomycetaceae bacterium]MBT6496040.1 protein kinase [Planctomycetaceae bacterium]
MSNHPANSPDLFSGESRKLEAILGDFESAWFRGERPDISQYLDEVGNQPERLLSELVHVDLEFRLKQGETARIEEYIGRFPKLAESTELMVELVCFEFDLRRRQTEAVSVAEYVGRFPELAAELTRRLPASAAQIIAEATVPTHAAPMQGVERIEPDTGSSRLSINVITGPHRGQTFETDRHETLLVGRGSDAHLQLIGDPHFSRYHLRLEIVPPGCRLIDLESRNGTYVNGHRVETANLQDGDVISGGTTRILVTVQHNSVQHNSVETPSICDFDSTDGQGSNEDGVELSSSTLPTVRGYQLKEHVGSGVTGRVYRAVHLASGETVAIKLIRTTGPNAHKAMLQFIRLMQRLVDLQHAGIVALREVGIAGASPFVATEFIESVSFESVMNAERPEGRDRLACRIVGRVLDTLEYAHQESLVHGGIKVSNVLLSASDRRLSVKLCDFGLSMNWMDASLSSIAGTVGHHVDLAFMPPEQVRDCRHTSAAADIYAAGVLLYWLLCGTEPFDCSSEHRVFDQILNARPTPLTAHRPDIPAELASIIDRAIQRDPAERFERAGQMAVALQQYSKPNPKS